MKNVLISALCALVLVSPLEAQEADDAPVVLVPVEVGDAELADFKWVNRVLVIFADSPLDPSFAEQITLLAERPDALMDRDVVILTDADPDARSPIRTELRPRGFALVIVDKDGRVMLRKPDPWDIREITRAIDKTPLRQQEIRDEKEAARTGG